MIEHRLIDALRVRGIHATLSLDTDRDSFAVVTRSGQTRSYYDVNLGFKLKEYDLYLACYSTSRSSASEMIELIIDTAEELSFEDDIVSMEVIGSAQLPELAGKPGFSVSLGISTY